MSDKARERLGLERGWFIVQTWGPAEELKQSTKAGEGEVDKWAARTAGSGGSLVWWESGEATWLLCEVNTE